VSREISEELGGRLVIEASQAGAIVVGDEGVEVGVAFGMIVKAAVGAQLRSAFEMLAEAAVEALDHAICLRPKGLGEAVVNLMAGTGAIERMLARGLVVGFGFLVDGKAIGEFGAVVGQHGVDGERKTVEKALQESRRGVRPAIGEDLEVDKAGGAVDRDVGVAAAAVERWQVFDVNVDKTGRGVGVKGRRRGFLAGEASRDPMPLQATVDGAARQLGVEAAPHHLDNVVERHGEAAAQLDHQGFFPRRQRGVQPVRPGRAVDDIRAGFPARNRAAVDAEFAGQRRVARLAFLDVDADARGGGGIGMEFEIHQPALPLIGRLRHRGCVRETLAPVGPQAPPTRRPARLAAVAVRARGSLPWTTGTSCASSRSRCFNHSIA
jgi:hypothetical protein